MSAASFTGPAPPSLRSRRLPTWTPATIGVLSIVIAYILFSVAGLLGGGMTLTVAGAVVIFMIMLGAASRIVEGPRAARNRVATALIYTAFALAALPLL